MRKELGTLLTVGGAALIWLLYKHLHGPKIHERFIMLTSKNGRCGIRGRQEEIRKVVLRRSKGDQVHWIIRNPKGSGPHCSHDVRVCIGRWERNGEPSDSPVVDLRNDGLCRVVPRPRTRPIHAAVRPTAPDGLYSYKVLIDGEVAVDPMVEIVP